MIKDNTIILGDCLEELKLLDDNSIDMILADPPYNIAGKGKLIKTGNKIIDTMEYFGHYDTYEDKEYLDWMEEIIIELSRIIKDGGNVLIFLGRQYVNIIERIFTKYNFKSMNTISIVKRNPLPHFRKNGFRSGFELGLWLCKGDKPKSFNFLEQKDMINYDLYTIGNKDTTHPNEKPLSIIKKYIKILSNENDIVLDLFSGSGTTCVGCKELNRRYVGIERDKEYYDMSIKRLEKTEKYNNKDLLNF